MISLPQIGDEMGLDEMAACRVSYKPDDQTGIYLLFDGDVLVYIGQTTKLAQRLYTHWKGAKVWDSYSFYVVDPARLVPVESRLIHNLMPKYNLAVPVESAEYGPKSLRIPEMPRRKPLPRLSRTPPTYRCLGCRLSPTMEATA